MKETIINQPHRLSNNVITRPMMQELVFPVLAFIGGDGEINYWAALKKGFEHLGINMPPIVPRLSFTFISERIVKLLQQRVLDAEEIINAGAEHLKQNWLRAQTQIPIDTMFHEAINSMEQIHQPLRAYSSAISPDLAAESKRISFISNSRSII